MAFKIGDLVKWKSQSQSYWKEKTGRIIAIVQPGVIPWDCRNKLYDRTKYHRQFDGYGRHEVSYLVSVETGPKAKPKLYWPKVSKLEKA